MTELTAMSSSTPTARAVPTTESVVVTIPTPTFLDLALH
jgi:hypothetical protein